MTERYKKIFAIFEIERAIKFLRIGLSEIQKINGANDFYDPIFIYLSSGIERLFKTMLCLEFEDKNSIFPNPNNLWNNRNGHDLEVLKSKVEEICIPLERPFVSMDYGIITTDELINTIIKILSEYGKRGRYFNMDVILGKEQDFDPRKEWEKVETQMAKEIYGEKGYYDKLMEPNKLNEIYEVCNKEIVIRLEKFFRALTRQFTFGNFTKEGGKYFYQIDDFAMIRDERLGETDYTKLKITESVKW